MTAASASSSFLRPFRLCIPPHTSGTRHVASSSLSLLHTHTHNSLLPLLLQSCVWGHTHTHMHAHTHACAHIHTHSPPPYSYRPVSGTSESTKPLLCLLGRELETEKKFIFLLNIQLYYFPGLYLGLGLGQAAQGWL